MAYIDGFLLPLPTSNIDEYRRQAQAAGQIWIEHGALAFQECIADDMTPQGSLTFPELIKTQAGETVVFSYIVFESREHRDQVNAKVMADPRLKNLCDPDNMPFDCKRMAYGGFNSLVSL
ncbi:DUF1428 domain-containing protein [Methylomicrobium lacus]|uniref:DUF1428 domain-containing protein n=1 Tax=Methylomicrobium lacus TaxID=136992 RepID=UPI00045EC0FD|nr:DUF1428 domain-containing protein [Methylomicrobium lacus]